MFLFLDREKFAITSFWWLLNNTKINKKEQLKILLVKAAWREGNLFNVSHLLLFLVYQVVIILCLSFNCYDFNMLNINSLYLSLKICFHFLIMAFLCREQIDKWMNFGGSGKKFFLSNFLKVQRFLVLKVDYKSSQIKETTKKFWVKILINFTTFFI